VHRCVDFGMAPGSDGEWRGDGVVAGRCTVNGRTV
jgi:hypothetical protein